jgi:alpha-D-xyloside xylohydrolase
VPQLRGRLEPLETAAVTANLDGARLDAPVVAARPAARWSTPSAVAAHWQWLALGAMVCLWAGLFGGLALTRHAAGGTSAEDLGFHDQVIWNFLRGQWFRMSVYEGATWNTEFDITRVARPDSLFAFHIEPILLLFVPFYALGADARLLLGLQALGFALGAIPAYALGARWGGTHCAGWAIAAAYLLSPFGQWAVLSDFHPTTLAAPLLLLAVERWAAGQPRVSVVAALIAMSAREDVAPAVACLGLVMALQGARRLGLSLLALSAVMIGGSIWLLRAYGGNAPPLALRYEALLHLPDSLVAALTRPEVGSYLLNLALSGGWLACLAPLLAVPALPSLVLNVLSSSPWMAAGKAHYSVLMVPFIIAGAAGGLGRIGCWQCALQSRHVRGARWLRSVAIGGLLVASGAGYLRAGAGPVAANYAPATVTAHAHLAQAIVEDLPPTAGVSASASLVPLVTHRARVYVFPTIQDAEYVFLDVTNGNATSAGDVYQRATALLAGGDWAIQDARDGLLLLARRERGPGLSAADLPAAFYSFVQTGPAAGDPVAEQSGDIGPRAKYLDGALELLTAEVLPSPTGTVAPDGPRGLLRTTWRATSPLPAAAWPRFHFDLRTGEWLSQWDLAALWWYPPERWRPGERIRIDVPNIPLQSMTAWVVEVPSPGGSSAPPTAPLAPAIAPTADQSVRLGDLTIQVEAHPWRLRLLDPMGRVLWEEAVDYTVGFRTADGQRRRATRLAGISHPATDVVRLVAATDDPTGRDLTIEVRSLSTRTLRLSITPGAPTEVRAVSGAILAPADEQFVGFGEQFSGVNQRGRRLDMWAEDRVLAGHGNSTYAPLPLLLSSRGHGFVLERFERSRFDLAATQADRWVWEQDAASATILIAYASSLKELVQRLATTTGAPPLPPIWAFGVWKTAVGGEDVVLAEAQRLRALGVPISAIYAYDSVDFAANLGWPDVSFAGRTAGTYPDPRAFTAGLHQLGMKALTYFRADFLLDWPNYDEPARLGFLVKAVDGQPYVHPRFPVSWLDFTNPRAVDWWGKLWQRALIELGYGGGMLDVAEILPGDAYLADGTRGAETHNRYPLLYAQAAWQQAARLRPDGDFVLFARSAAVGAQRFQSLQWPGDALMQWDAPGGLRSLVPAALSFGLSGFPYWHPEVAGYIQTGLSHAEERELWLRWLQVASWSPTLRDHYGEAQSDPVDAWLDESTLAAFRDAARIHNSLIPYLYTLAHEAHRTGLPMMRFLPLEASDDPRAWREEQSYFLGPLLLMAPVVEPGAISRRVYLPAGEWVDFWTDRRYQGGEEITVPAPLDGGRAPVFVRAGAVLPLADTFDSLVNSPAPGVRTWAGDLVVRIMPGGAGASTFTLYDGTRLAWDGATTLHVLDNAHPRHVTLRLPSGEELGQRVEATRGEIRAPE